MGHCPCYLVFFGLHIEAKAASEGKEAVEAKPPVDALRISGLGEACSVAAAAAVQVLQEVITARAI